MTTGYVLGLGAAFLFISFITAIIVGRFIGLYAKPVGDAGDDLTDGHLFHGFDHAERAD